MPIYDYLCSACDHRLEVIHGVHDDGPRYCSACGAEGTMRKAIVPSAIVFKGSGWAKKDRSSRSGASRTTSTDATEGAAPTDGSSTSAPGDGDKPSPTAASE
jgi:putative FmdB family regulatory protein